MYILLQGHNYRYEISEFLKLFSSEFSFIECSEDFGVNREGELLVNKLELDRASDRVRILTKSQVYKEGQLIYERELSQDIDLEDYEKKFAKINKKIDNDIKTISKTLSIFPSTSANRVSSPPFPTFVPG